MFDFWRNWIAGLGSVALVRFSDSGVNRKEAILVVLKPTVIQTSPYRPARRLEPEKGGFYALRGAVCSLTYAGDGTSAKTRLQQVLLSDRQTIPSSFKQSTHDVPCQG